MPRARRPRPAATRVLTVLLLISATPLSASATWSIVAVDLQTREVGIASATCVTQAAFAGFPAEGLMDIQAIVLPGGGAAVAQAAVDPTRQDQEAIFRDLETGTNPEEILEGLQAGPDSSRHQYAVVDLRGRSAAFTGAENGAVALDVQNRVTHGRPAGKEIVFSVQGNLLADEKVVHEAARAFHDGEGDLAERLMRAMEAADREGGDRRCTCETEPKTAATADCVTKTAHVAYLLVAKPGDRPGKLPNDGEYSLFLNVTDENIRPQEDANPVKTLRLRYDAWRSGRRP